MGSRRTTGDSVRLPVISISRRAVIGATTAAPVLASAPNADNETVARCRDWIALDREIDRLALRWSKIETLMVRDHGWFALTAAEQRALPQAAEMFAIDEQLEALYLQRERLLSPLSHLPTETLQAIAGKLVVAARLLQHEDHPAQPFVAGAARAMTGMCCPGCGANYVPARTGAPWRH